MEATAWRLNQFLWWRCGGREFVHGFSAFGSDLGGICVVFGWLDLGPVVVIFSDGFDGGFRCLLGLFGNGFQ